VNDPFDLRGLSALLEREFGDRSELYAESEPRPPG